MTSLVKLLDCPQYPPDANFPCTEQRIQFPTWTQVETAICELDKHSRPFIVLAPVADESERFDGESEFFEVLGGQGDYWVAGSMNGYWQRRAVNPSGGETEIVLWTSDQGFSSPSRYVLHDLGAVLHAAKYYYEHNGFDPALEWENQTPLQEPQDQAVNRSTQSRGN